MSSKPYRGHGDGVNEVTSKTRRSLKRKPCAIRLTQRDIELFLFLFKYKVGTLRQLAKYPFQGASYQACGLRLSSLVRGEYLLRYFMDHYDDWRCYYSITNKALHQVKQELPYTLCQKQKKSNHPIHDIELLEVGEWLSRRQLVTDFIQENILQCCEEVANSSDYMSFTQIHSDGAFKVKIKDETFKLALEYESTVKSKRRIRDKLSEYLQLSDIRAILYVCKNKSIEKSIRGIEKEIFTSEVSRVFYCQFDDILSSPEHVEVTDFKSNRWALK